MCKGTSLEARGPILWILDKCVYPNPFKTEFAKLITSVCILNKSVDNTAKLETFYIRNDIV